MRNNSDVRYNFTSYILIYLFITIINVANLNDRLACYVCVKVDDIKKEVN